MNFRKIKITSFWHYQLLGWTIFLLNQSGLIWQELSTSGNSLFLLLDFYVVFFLSTLLLRYIYRSIYRPSKPLSGYFIVISVSSVLVSILLGESRILDNYLFGRSDTWLHFPRGFSYLLSVIYDSWPAFVWSVLYFGIRYWQDMETEKKRADDAILMAQKAQLQMLRYQLNPHFLFNSLNSIQALVHENPDQADNVVTELSEFLRATLQYNDRLMIPMSEEIEITRKYLSIEKIRYEERLEYSMEVDDKAKEIEIPCFLTQPLVENSIKHGLLNNPKGIRLILKFFIFGNELIIEIANTGKLSENWSAGVGIKNILDRLENSYPGRFRFSLYETFGFVIARIIITHTNEKNFLSHY